MTMQRGLILAALLTLTTGAWLLTGSSRPTQAADEGGTPLVHSVYFSLKESTPENRKKLVAACQKYLSRHPGEVYFAAGPLAEDLKREVNDRDFDVALTIVFKDRAAHDTYQDAKRHLRFIEENKASWKKVRVFDSLVQK